MSTQPYQQAIASTRSVLTGVKADQMGAATPCASWTVAELINHIVGAQHFFIAGMQGTPPVGADSDYSSGDYVAAFDEICKENVAAFSADGVLEKMISMPFGDMPGAAVMGLATTDTFQHGWDLAQATGQPTDLAPELAAGLLERSRKMIQDGFRGPEGAPFGAEQSAPEGASNADRLAAFLGRAV